MPKMKEADPKPYSFEEAYTSDGGFPDRGTRCYRCNTLIPQFEGMDAQRHSEWRHTLKHKGDQAADDYLMSLTGCPPRWAKIWRLHRNGPSAPSGTEASLDRDTTCPFCEKPLRTKRAQQCPHCFKSWHNTDLS